MWLICQQLVNVTDQSEQPQSFMIIHKLQLENFKSYNGTHDFGPFDSHFTCVIGPNGNGKSNIIDAVLFVFGFKSSKLRQNSLASLIHKSAFARPDSASVTVIFQEEQVLSHVSRTIYKSGHSYYKLNGEKIGWTQLREKLVSKKIDLNKNLFIILQGEVERLCELSPEKMVEYIEYVSGSDEYKEIIDETQQKFIAKSITKEEVRASLNVKKKMFDKLKETAVQQATWMMLRQKVMLYQHLALKKIFMENHQLLRALEQNEKEKVAECQKVEAEIEAHQEKLNQKAKELKEIKAQCTKGQNFIQQIQQRTDGITLKVKEVSREINYMVRDKEKIEQEKARVSSQVQELYKISKQHEEFKLKNSEISSQLKEYKEVSKLKICMQMEEKLKDTESSHQEIAKKYTQAKASLDQDKEKYKLYELKYKQNKELISECRGKLKKIGEELTQLNVSITDNTQSLAQLDRQIKEQPNEKNQNHQQKLLAEIRSANKVKLICSEITLVTLRQLIIIDPNYADVVETILPHLDFFIVNNLKQAKEIMDYLNKKKLGRMTVLIRQSISQATKDTKLPTTSPKDTKLLLEVCKCTDQQTKNILYWAIGSTLVTSKLETAMKVAYYDERPHRVITTNGEFIDTSGTITKLPLKNGAKRQDEEYLLKKQATIKRTLASLAQRKEELAKEQQEIQTTLLQVQNEERSLDGLDEVFLKEQQAQLKQMAQKSTRQQNEIIQSKETLRKIKDKLTAAGFKMCDYEKVLELLKQQTDNECKIKKIQNSHNLHISLAKKLEEVNKAIQKMNEALQEKMRQKSKYQTEKLRLTEIIESKTKELDVILYGISMVEQEIKTISKEKRQLQEKVGQSNRKPGLQPKEELRKVRTRIKNAQLQKLQLLSKLFESIKQIKDYSYIVYKTLFSKCPELVVQSQRVGQELSILSVIEQTVLVLGKTEYKFTAFLNEKENQLLFGKIKNNSSIYCELEDLRPSDPEADLLFESISSKEVKFGHSFQMQKVKRYQKEITKSDSGEYQIDFQLFGEYLARKKECQISSQQLAVINNHVEGLKSELIELRNKRLNIFLGSFNEINVELNKIYMQLTGGRAEINLIDSMNPLEGIQFSVRPVNKSWKRVNLLSGGEKTFTSLALIFACQEIKKFPFYFMDEIDAALDYKNTTLLAQYITSKKSTQHIVISLRKNMYQECNRVVGIYKIMDQSKKIESNMSDLTKKEQKTSN